MMSELIKSEDFDFFVNPTPARSEPYGLAGRKGILCLENLDRAKAEITSWSGYVPTPLRRLPGIAKAAGVSQVLLKDEGSRFGLGSFKALGGAYAVLALLAEQLEKKTGRRPGSADLIDGNLRELTSEITVACATDGNHGKSVAWGARTFGCRCIIYVHENVSPARCAAIAAYGAEIRVIKGTYDDAVRRAAEDAQLQGWHIVSDTSYEGYIHIPRNVMQGYGLLLEETYAQIRNEKLPTHLFIQGGVGGLAASMCSYLWERFDRAAPTIVVVEPKAADCIIRTARAGKPTSAEGDLNTIMAGLACGEVSLIAWEILRPGVDAFQAISDAAAAETMRLLASGKFGDRPVVAGESAVAGLAGFLLASERTDLRHQLKLNKDSVVLAICTEGATDPVVYQQIVGRSVAEVLDNAEGKVQA